MALHREQPPLHNPRTGMINYSSSILSNGATLIGFNRQLCAEPGRRQTSFPLSPLPSWLRRWGIPAPLHKPALLPQACLPLSLSWSMLFSHLDASAMYGSGDISIRSLFCAIFVVLVLQANKPISAGHWLLPNLRAIPSMSRPLRSRHGRSVR